MYRRSAAAASVKESLQMETYGGWSLSGKCLNKHVRRLAQERFRKQVKSGVSFHLGERRHHGRQSRVGELYPSKRSFQFISFQVVEEGRKVVSVRATAS